MRSACMPAVLVCSLLAAGCGREEAPDSAPVPVADVPLAEIQLDPVTGLKMAENWELVRANCTPCHSAKLVTQQRGSASQWLTMIRWMQEKQNLWQFDPVTEEKIIAYLADNYAPSAARRRAALPPDLMPPNPYSTTSQ